MSLNKKYANLPDLDLAPDVYETPDLTDGASTVPTTTIRTNSDSDSESNPDIDRNGLNTDEARLHFLRASGVNARDVDFSDTISTKRKAYKNRTSRRRRRQHEDGTEDFGDSGDSDEEESFERKLARLRRETEELKAEIEEKKQEGREIENNNNTDIEDSNDGILELSKALDTIHFASARNSTHSPDAALLHKLDMATAVEKKASTKSKDNNESAAKLSAGPPPATPSGLLAHAASFDSRLALLESALGVSSGSNPFIAENNAEPSLHPILPALDHLTSQLTVLTSTLGGPTPTSAVSTSGSTTTTTIASTNSQLEALSTRIKKLTADADSLANARRRASEAAAKSAASADRIQASPADNFASGSSNGTEVNAETTTQRDEQAAKIQALYATLPTIQSLHPVLPSVLERLRSLRAIHAGAAQASETLDALEKDQAEMSKEIEQWREGLLVVEEKVKESEGAMKKNIDVVGPWVKGLEARIAKFETD
ncbi:Dynamitin-domain-containing protein [Talaromyces proteolyticus]|uniref:Dynamitin-domain-containing protein n=1 Tax=Talaromyces proteolyticus TaxID=1131652 RepID=A0AAD4KQ00_9EURO|nr:Dynamitin-domain-containing protein [Talaromyces proteolyticus]KAH8697762.1 Dynamitin-domain-containing protein [Talaromyces proteolyticus]